MEMMNSDMLRVLADVVLIAHVSFVAFVVIGLLLILIGGFRGWNWIRNPWFRGVHLATIGFVIVQTWLGAVCPLTTLEMDLRERAGEETYRGGFIAYWLHQLLFYEAPPWVFSAAYTVFGFAVAVSWLKFRPRPFRTKRAPTSPA